MCTCQDALHIPMLPDQQRRRLEADTFHSWHIVCSITGQSQQVYKLHRQTQHPVKTQDFCEPGVQTCCLSTVETGAVQLAEKHVTVPVLVR